MKCPKCEHDFPLTWWRYIKASLGRMVCPLCQTKLLPKHRWFYWPLMLLGLCALGIPLAWLGGTTYGFPGFLTGLVLGGLASGLPFDKFLDTKFTVLRQRKGRSSKEPA